MQTPNNSHDKATHKAILSAARSWHAPQIVSSIQKNFNLSDNEAQQLFADVKLFLCLSKFNAQLFKTPLKPSKIIDVGWHEFLMFTIDYRMFCFEVLGAFIDHVPETDSPDIAVAKNASEFAKTYLPQLSANWSEVESDCQSCWGQPDHDETGECSSKVFSDLNLNTFSIHI
ncbi:hypothetical protein [Undibacterium sp. Di24W]|uniref:hypothetical protein n=1 Tax=Undibacterium sp. Di24W TaxID=3413033 RepID=UPI003BF1238E